MKLAGRAGSILNHNGLLLMVAARGQRSLLSAWGDFQQDPGVNTHTRTHLNLREAPQGERARQKATETVFFASHTPTDTIPLQEALGSIIVVVNRMLKAPSWGSFVMLLIIQRLRKCSNPAQQKLQFCANTSSLLGSPFKAAPIP